MKILYKIKLHTTDLLESITTVSPCDEYFTTAGPIVFKSFTLYTDTIPNPGDEISLRLELLNIGNVTTVPNVGAYIFSTDTTLAYISTYQNPIYGNITSGESKITTGYYKLKIKDNCPVDTTIILSIKITSNEKNYWEDTFWIDVKLSTCVESLAYPPNKYILKQNYPNPFNPSTTIKYSLPKRSNVTLKIFDVLSIEVATFLDKEQPEGNYEVEFYGSELTSGIYFYQLQVYPSNGGGADYVETKKMVLLK